MEYDAKDEKGRKLRKCNWKLADVWELQYKPEINLKMNLIAWDSFPSVQACRWAVGE